MVKGSCVLVTMETPWRLERLSVDGVVRGVWVTNNYLGRYEWSL